MDDLSAVQSIDVWNLSWDSSQHLLGLLTSTLTRCSNTIAQPWICLHDLARNIGEKTLFEIARVLGTPLTLDETTSKRTFGHYARVLIEAGLTLEMCERIIVERKDFDFHVDV